MWGPSRCAPACLTRLAHCSAHRPHLLMRPRIHSLAGPSRVRMRGGRAWARRCVVPSPTRAVTRRPFAASALRRPHAPCWHSTRRADPCGRRCCGWTRARHRKRRRSWPWAPTIRPCPSAAPAPSRPSGCCPKPVGSRGMSRTCGLWRQPSASAKIGSISCARGRWSRAGATWRRAGTATASRPCSLAARAASAGSPRRCSAAWDSRTWPRSGLRGAWRWVHASDR
mmetsp:Transcript_10420/g.34532  ORF Transcript_10420/g.34532 Transcript_10420/m.34532 type:complete len:226 (+) Transcript_10420:117-794(+)